MTTAVKKAGTRTIDLRTELPGPRARAVLARRDAAVAKGLYRSCPVVAERARGAAVTDVDGNTFLDLTSGIGAVNVGHCAEPVTAAIREQAERLLHLCAIVGTYEPYVALCEKLHEVVPIAGRKKTLLTNTGVDAVENAVKIARAHTGRAGVAVFEGAFHGRSLLGMTMTSKYDLYKKSFGPFAPEVYRLPFPYPYRCRRRGCGGEACAGLCFDDLESALVTHVDPSAVAAVVIEPVQGEGGFIPVPDDWMRRLRELCDQTGMLLVADEVQSGFCRTGRMFAIEHSGVEPDLVVMAKGIGAGMPIGAVTGKASIMDTAHVGGLGSTYGGNPVACAAAIAAIDFMREHDLAGRARRIGEVTMNRCNRWKQRYAIIGDVRGLGAMCAIEFVEDRATKKPSKTIPARVVEEGYQRGLILIRAGILSSCVRTLAPLTISDDELDEALNALEQAIATVDGEQSAKA